MNTNTLRQIIKEELQSVLLLERMQSKFMTKLFNDNKSSRARWGGQLNKALVASGYDLATYPDSAIAQYTGTARSLKSKKGIFLIIAKRDSEQQLYAAGRYGWSNTVRPGQILGMAINGKVGYIAGGGEGSRLTTTKPGRYTAGRKVGLDEKGKRSLKSLDEFDHEIFQLGIDQAGTDAMKAKQAARQEQKLGATAFTTDREFKKANLSRYKELVRAAKLSKTGDIDKKVFEAIQHANKQVELAYKVPEVDQYGNLALNPHLSMKDFSYNVHKMHDYYANVIQLRKRIDDNAAKYGMDAVKYDQERLNDATLDLQRVVNFILAEKAG